MGPERRRKADAYYRCLRAWRVESGGYVLPTRPAHLSHRGGYATGGQVGGAVLVWSETVLTPAGPFRADRLTALANALPPALWITQIETRLEWDSGAGEAVERPVLGRLNPLVEAMWRPATGLGAWPETLLRPNSTHWRWATGTLWAGNVIGIAEACLWLAGWIEAPDPRNAPAKK